MLTDNKVRQGASTSLGHTSVGSLPTIKENLLQNNRESIGNRKATSAMKIQQHVSSDKKNM